MLSAHGLLREGGLILMRIFKRNLEYKMLKSVAKKYTDDV